MGENSKSSLLLQFEELIKAGHTVRAARQRLNLQGYSEAELLATACSALEEIRNDESPR